MTQYSEVGKELIDHYQDIFDLADETQHSAAFVSS